MALTIEQFGQKIKEKYPQYKDVSDSDLGNKMLQKYPQYKDLVSLSTSDKLETPQKTVSGSETALLPAQPAKQAGIFEGLKVIPNALADIFNIAKEATFGTVKKIVSDIPQAAGELAGREGFVKGAVSFAKEIPKSTADVISGFIPQSAKELANIDAITQIPKDFQELAKLKGGYANAFIDIAKEIPESFGTGVMDYVNQIDRARQAFENHPVAEILGYAGLKYLSEHPSQAVGQGKAMLKSTGEFVRHPISSTGEAFTPILDSVKSRLLQGKSIEDQAFDIVSPKLTQKIREEYLKRGKVTQPGVLKPSKLEPTSFDTKLIESVKPLVEDGRLKASDSPIRHIEVINDEISNLDSHAESLARDADLQLINKFPKNYELQFDKALNDKFEKIKTESESPFISDVQSAGAYQDTIDFFKKRVTEKSASGVFQARKSFDSFMRTHYPEVFKKIITGELTPATKARIEAVRNVRQAGNEFVADYLPEGNPFLGTLKNESNLIRVIERIASRETAIIGKNKMQIFMKAHPAVRQALRMGEMGITAGIGIKGIESVLP